MEILIVEDDPRMAELLRRGLEREGHVPTVTHDGVDALDIVLGHEFDAVLLDVMIPRMNGFEVARRLRERGCRVPILMLTAKDTSRDIVSGLDTGADDYLTKPFSFEELLARLRAVARRAPITNGPILSTADLTLDPATHRVRRGERDIELTPREFQLLELFLRRKGKVLARESIIEAVWGHVVDVEPNTVDVHVSTLRRKVDAGGEPALIHTVRGVGFTLKEPDD